LYLTWRRTRSTAIFRRQRTLGRRRRRN